MKEEELKKMPIEFLKKKIKGHKTLLGISIGLSIFFAFLGISDYLNDKEMNMINLIMIPCLFTGIFSLFPELKTLQKELANRN